MRKQVSVNETTFDAIGGARGGESSVGTLARGLDVLELFGSERPELAQKEISESLGLPMPTVHRLVGLLADRGWLDRDPGSRRLRLGLQTARLVPALLAGMRLPELARPHLARIAADVDETVNLATLQGSEIVYLLSESGDRLLSTHVMVGMRLPAHCTALGKCLLAELPDDVARAALGREPYAKRTERTVTTWTKLAAELTLVRDAGVAISEQEYEAGLVSIAAPVRWIDGPGSAAINVSLPTGRATPAFRDRLAKRLVRAAAEISGALG
jgi:DNA-binding IclR family transcriptional regulator